MKWLYEYYSRKFGFEVYKGRAKTSIMHFEDIKGNKYTKTVRPVLYRGYEGDIYIKPSKDIVKYIINSDSKVIKADCGTCVTKNNILFGTTEIGEKVELESKTYERFSLCVSLLFLTFLGWTLCCVIAGLYGEFFLGKENFWAGAVIVYLCIGFVGFIVSACGYSELGSYLSDKYFDEMVEKYKDEIKVRRVK